MRYRGHHCPDHWCHPAKATKCVKHCTPLWHARGLMYHMRSAAVVEGPDTDDRDAVGSRPSKPQVQGCSGPSPAHARPRWRDAGDPRPCTPQVEGCRGFAPTHAPGGGMQGTHALARPRWRDAGDLHPRTPQVEGCRDPRPRTPQLKGYLGLTPTHAPD